MSRLGRIEQWNDGKGYGFVRPLESQAGADAGTDTGANTARAFVHASAIARAGRRPADGDLVRYRTERDAKGRLNAVGVSFVNAPALRAQARGEAATDARGRRGPDRRAGVARRIVGAAAVAVIAGGWLLGFWPGVVPLLYAAMGLLSFLAYRHDKVAAGRGRRRTPESTLHAIDLLGGWPGGLLAQQAFRHKTGKASFQLAFWLTVALNCAAFAWLLQEGGFERLQRMLAT